MSEKSFEHVVPPPGRPVEGSLRDILMSGMTAEQRLESDRILSADFKAIRESERLAELNGNRIISPDGIEEMKR